MPLGGTSGTYDFAPSLGDLVLYAFGLCGVRRTAILQEHMADANIAANLVLSDWLNQGVNLWQVMQYTTSLTAGVSDYDVGSEVLAILDTYVTIGSYPNEIDRIILPVSRTEYSSYPNKAQRGFPTVFWYERVLPFGTIHLWPVPDGNQIFLKFYALRQSQDANFINGQQPEIPYAWQYAFATALAEKLAVSWAPEKLAILAPIAAKAYATAAQANVETAQQYITPQLQGYFR
jgi:hypothetical protein